MTKTIERNFQISNNLSLMGDVISDVALVTLMYQLTHSPIQIGSLLVFKVLAIFISGLLVPATAHLMREKRQWTFAMDLLRAGAMMILVVFPSELMVYAISFLNSLILGFYHPNKQFGVQSLIASDRRTSYLATNQAWSNLISLTGPVVAGILLQRLSPERLLIVDAISFLASAVLILRLPPWQQDQPSVSLLERVRSGYAIIFANADQRQILKSRLFLLLCLAAFDLFQIQKLTELSGSGFIDFALGTGLLSSISAIGMLIASISAARWPEALTLNSRIRAGLSAITVGLLIATSLELGLVPQMTFFFLPLLAYFGLGWARVGVHSRGLQITPKSVFVEVVASTDAISRLWQSGIYACLLGLATTAFWPAALSLIGVMGLAHAYRSHEVSLPPMVSQGVHGD